ncbi:MAG: TetR/AcrR family transcriptional regulator [Solirubrobacteraceae bacterium]
MKRSEPTCFGVESASGDAQTPLEAERYSRLPAGLHGMPAADVAHSQRKRLCAAIADLVAQRGCSAVRVSDLTTLAGVSRPTFYELFEDKESCLLATYEEIAGDAAQALADAGRRPRRGELRAALQTLADLAVARPEQASLLVLGSLGAGPAVRAAREATLRTLSTAMLRQRAAARGGQRATRREPARRARPSAGERLLVTMLIGGVGEIAAKRLRRGCAEELTGLVEPLAEWIGRYRAAPPSALAPPTGAVERRAALLGGDEPLFPRASTPAQPLPGGRHGLSALYVARNQRKRMLDALAACAAADGYARLAIPAIAKRAHVSHQTFYEHFPSKQEAFLTALRAGAGGLLRVCSEGFTADLSWPEAVAAGIHQALRGLAAEPAYARLGVVEALAGGPDALELREQAMGELAALLDRGGGQARPDREAPAITAEAVVGGAWQAIHLEIAAGRTSSLPLIAPPLIYFALTPYLGAEQAARHARRRPPRRGRGRGD